MTGQTKQLLAEEISKAPEPSRILATKLYVPAPRTNAVARPHLVEMLLSGVNRPGGFSLLAGPAGFGKTTLLTEFVARTQRLVAWVSLDEGDNDPRRFWTYVLKACRSILADIGESALELLGAPQPLPEHAIPTLLINELASYDRPVTLILDDYHEIRDPSIHEDLLLILEHLPPHLHIVISTRTDPPWPLTRFRARNQLVEIRAQDLRFSVEETAQFMNQTMGLDLSAGEVAALEARTEGWIAGLQLAALSMQGQSDVAGFIQAFTGSHVYIAEYLVEEILQRQPEELQLFLLQTSILTRMNPGLCEAVTGHRGSQEVLRDLHRANVFVVPLDNEGQWFRYHHLFGDLLRARLRQRHSPDAVAGLRLRAADWYEQNGYVLEAVNQAMAAEAYERAASLLDRAGQEMIFTDQYMVLNNLLDALPGNSFRNHPRLEVYRVLLDLSLGRLDMFEQTLLEKKQLVDSLPTSPENDRLRMQATVYLCSFFAHQNTSRAIQIAQEAQAEIPNEEVTLHASLYSALYRAYGMEGDIARSAPAYRESLRLAQAAGEYGMIGNTTMVRAFDLCQYGRLDEAADYCQLIIDVGVRQKRRVFFPAGPCYIGLAGIHLERYELEPAEQHLEQGLGLCRQGAMYGLYTGYIQQARFLQATGDPEEAWEVLRRLEQTLQRRDFTLTARQVSILLAMGDVAGATELTPSILEVLGKSRYSQDLPLIADEAFKVCLARIYIAQGDVEAATRLLNEIQVTAEPGQRFGRLLEVFLLRALAEQKNQDDTVAPASVQYALRALSLGQQSGMVLLFLEEGRALIPLLHATLDHRSAADSVRQYARRLLDAFAADLESVVDRSDDVNGALVEPLTPREMDVLRLIAFGDSNQEIADELVITVRTVKKHITNILGKLGVSNRTHAVARARALGLLSSD